MPEPLVDKSVDDNLAAEAEKLLAQDMESSGEAPPAEMAAQEAEAELSASVEKLLAESAEEMDAEIAAQQMQAPGEPPGASADGATPEDAGGSTAADGTDELDNSLSSSLDADLASLTESLLADDMTQAAAAVSAQAAEAEEQAALPTAQAAAQTVTPAAAIATPAASPSTSAAGGAPEAKAADAHADASAARTTLGTAPTPAAEASVKAGLDAAAKEVEIPPAPEPGLPPAEAVGKAAAESIAANAAKKDAAKKDAARHEAAKTAPAPTPAKEVAGATLEDLKPSLLSRLLRPLGFVPRAIVGVCAAISKPIAGKPSVVRDSIGWLSVSTLFCGISLWGYALVFRKPPEPPTPKEPVALIETAEGHQTSYAKRTPDKPGGEGAKKEGGHEAKKAEPKKETKKAEPKKTEAKGHADAKKGAAKKEEH